MVLKGKEKALKLQIYFPELTNEQKFPTSKSFNCLGENV